MKYKFSRIACFIDKYGIFKGISLYFVFKFKHATKIKVPGISSAFFLRKNTSDAAVFDQVFLHGDYNINFSFVPTVIVDAGANIGLFTIVMKNRFPEAKVICVEPDKDNYEILKKNVSGYKNVELMHAGLWSSETKLNVVDKYEMGHSALVVEENKEKGDVQAITIDMLMRTQHIDRIDVLKIDIETSERELFLQNYEEWLPKVRLIIIELHDWMKDGCSKPFFEAINKSFNKYSYAICGANTIIENKDLNCQ
ncbi:FkbM family methyltransferase [Panacibacter ginsenosidivorans]|uniref:FkbM family methyltransferase n=1 Tax=Panacibacter ginsenosidivorans TaxID=1813871 RepID=A0A5B8V6Z6_9BACT|nr:FkbM family methyltransferase [Panacibacter ginsenosidivorans]QEC67082.1 FkbM family methyltransferase [Panacibacter ginsenosidivorans]